MIAKQLRFAVCDDQLQEQKIILELLHKYIDKKDYVVTIDTFSNGEELLTADTSCYNLIILISLADGANGMECVYQTKKYNQDALVFWFSDDRNFGIQSHRLECTYFAEKPLTDNKLSKALSYCQNIGISI